MYLKEPLLGLYDFKVSTLSQPVNLIETSVSLPSSSSSTYSNGDFLNFHHFSTPIYAMLSLKVLTNLSSILFAYFTQATADCL